MGADSFRLEQTRIKSGGQSILDSCFQASVSILLMCMDPHYKLCHICQNQAMLQNQNQLFMNMNSLPHRYFLRFAAARNQEVCKLQ